MQKMTDEQRMRVVLTYPTATMRINVEDCDLINIGYAQDRLYLLGKSSKDAYDVHVSEVQIVVRPVSSLTDKECIEVARMLNVSYSNTNPEAVYDQEGLIDDMKLLIERGESYSYRPYKGVATLIDYLRSINIITIVHGLDLVQCGVAIVESNHKS